MSDRIVVNSDQKTYVCYREVTNELTEHADEINEKLNSMREMLDGMIFSVGKKPVSYELCCYIDKEINAFACNSKVCNYLIAVSTGILTGMEEELEEYLRNQDLKKYFWGASQNVGKHVEKVLEDILMFVVLHEYYHILNGHCDAAELMGICIKEIATDRGKERNRFLQIMECDADYCAARSCMYFIAERYKDKEELKTEVCFLGFALYYIFLKFQENGYEDFDYPKNLYAKEHPPASIRFVYVFAVLAYCISHETDERNALEIINRTVSLGIYFDRIYYDAETFKESLSALAYTTRGTGHIDELHMGWNAVRKKLRKFAHVKLRRNQRLNMQELSWVNCNGEIIQSKLVDNILKYCRRRCTDC